MHRRREVHDRRHGAGRRLSDEAAERRGPDREPGRGDREPGPTAAIAAQTPAPIATPINPPTMPMPIVSAMTWRTTAPRGSIRSLATNRFHVLVSRRWRV